MKIYHGSEDIIIKPKYELGKSRNDFGKGFYCTQDIERAKEWACKNNNNGIVNEYELKTDKLKILDLTTNEYNLLNWISILLKFRSFNTESQTSSEAKEFLIKNYYIDINKYDLVIGYRADDSYFSYAQSFVNNSLSVENLEKAMKLGNLGKQIVLVSKESFKHIKYIKYYSIDKNVYYNKFKNNDSKARNDLKKISSNKNDTYIIDILRKGKEK